MIGQVERAQVRGLRCSRQKQTPKVVPNMQCERARFYAQIPLLVVACSCMCSQHQKVFTCTSTSNTQLDLQPSLLPFALTQGIERGTEAIAASIQKENRVFSILLFFTLTLSLGSLSLSLSLSLSDPLSLCTFYVLPNIDHPSLRVERTFVQHDLVNAMLLDDILLFLPGWGWLD